MSTDDEDFLKKLLDERSKQCQKYFDRLKEAKFSGVKGISKIKCRIASEMKFLKSFESGEKKLERKYLETSNILHLSNIIDLMDKTEGLEAVMQTFAIRNLQAENGEEDEEDDEYNPKPAIDKHTVDIVGRKGKQWIKVISRSPRGILMDWMTGSSRNVFQQARDYIDISRNFKKNFVPPEIWFHFVAGVPDLFAEQLQRHGVHVGGNWVESSSLAAIPEDYLEKLETELEDVDNNPVDGRQGCSGESVGKRDTSRLAPLNFDVSAVFVLISNMTHEGGTNYKFASKLLEGQAVRERELPARLELLKEIEDIDRWMICRTAFESVENILETVSGPTENARWEELKQKLELVEDCISERTKQLSTSDRVNERSMAIFGSGDHYKATTVTSNKHFISSAYHQGINYDVIVHEPRALSEQKERPMDWKRETPKKAEI